MLVLGAAVVLLAGCGQDRRRPSVLDPNNTERDLREALGVPTDAERVLILSQSSHLDIDWKETFDQYYQDHVEQVFLDAAAILDRDPDAFYSVAEMAYLARHVELHGAGTWPRHVESGHARIVGGGMTTPDTLLPTDEALIRDYLLGTMFAEQQLGARPHAAWLPDSFGHSPTVPDLLSAAGYTSVGFGRADGARHSYEVIVGKLDPIMPGVVTTASLLRDLGSADFVWRGPGGGEVLAHYMPVREYCQGDTIDLAGFALGGVRLGIDHDEDPEFVRTRIAEYIDQLTPYQRTPYLFVPVGCDFQAPRPKLTEYARWWNESEYARTGVWVVAATFEDYMKLVAFHRDRLPVMERDINPVWTGFYASRPRIKRAARDLVESLVGVEPFLALVGLDTNELAPAWHTAVLANHHDWITGTSKDSVVTDEQVPQLAAARASADTAWQRVLDALAPRVDTSAAPTGEVVVAVNPGPVARDEVVEVALADPTAAGPFHAQDGDRALPAQVIAPGRVAFLAAAVPAFGWRTFSIDAGAAPGATATLGADTAELATGQLDARFVHDADGWTLHSLVVGGTELLAGASVVWIVYSDSGGQYRIGSERPDCPDGLFFEEAQVRIETLTLVEAGPARVTLRGTATIDDRPMTIDFIASAGSRQLVMRVTGSAALDRTIMLRVQPAAADDALVMGVPAGVVTRPLEHVYKPSLWPAVTWVARGELAVHLAQSTAVHGTSAGALEWVVFRNALSEPGCDDVGPSGTEDVETTVELSLGRRDRVTAGAADLAASLALTRPLRAVATDRHAGDLQASGQLVGVEADTVVATALKPASRGDGYVLHLLRFGTEPATVRIRRGALPWSATTRPDLLERDDSAFGQPTADGATVTLDAALTAVRLRP